MITSLALLGLAFLLILANGFFVAAEFGLVAVERPQAERAAAAGDRRAARVVAALRQLSFQLSGTQLGITLTSLVVGMLAEPALGRLLRGPLTAAGLPAGAVPGTALAAGVLLASAAQMVLGELVPKNWAVSRPLAVARFVAGPQAAFSRFFRPLIALLNAAANRLVRLLGVELGRGAGVGPYAHRAGVAGAQFRAGRDDRAGRRRPVRTHPLARRADCAARDDPAGTGRRAAVLCHRRGRPQPHPRHRTVPLPRLRRTAGRGDRHGPPQGRPGRPRRPPGAHPRRADRGAAAAGAGDAAGAAAAGEAARRAADSRGRRRVRRHGGRRDAGGHRRGTGRRGPRRARPGGRRRPRPAGRPRRRRPPGVGCRRRLPPRRAAPDRADGAGGPVRDGGGARRRAAGPDSGGRGHGGAAGLAARRTARRPPPGGAGTAGAYRSATRPRCPPRRAGAGWRGGPRERAPTGLRRAAGAGQRVLRRCRVRPRLRTPQPDRAACRRRLPPAPAGCSTASSTCRR